MQARCAGHTNGFEHLDVEGIPPDVDCGRKLESTPRESDDYVIDPATGVKAWAEPYLPCYVSVKELAAPRRNWSLSYGLTRSRWRTQTQVGTCDAEELARLVAEVLAADVVALLHGEDPEASHRVKLL